MYELMPERMLSWRSITWLIDHYAPGVRLGIESTLPKNVTLDWVEWDAGGRVGAEPDLLGEVDDGVAPTPAEPEPPAPQLEERQPSQARSDQPPQELYDNLPEARGMR
jgi:hypothetical protein